MDLLMNDFKLSPELYHSECSGDCNPSTHSEPVANATITGHDISLDTVGWINYIVNVYIDSILCLFGFTGNLLILFVLSRDKSRSSNNVFLQALAVYDLLILGYTVFYTILRSVYPATGALTGYYSYSPYIIAIVLPIAWIAQTGTVWFTTLVAGDRYLAITYPFRVSTLCTYKRAVKVTLISSIIAVLFNIPRFGHYYLVARNMVRSNTTTSSGTFVAHIKVELAGWNEDLYHYIYHITLTFIFLYTIPLTLLVFFNCRLISALHKARKNQLAMSATATNAKNAYRHNNAITLNMIIIITKFILCQTPDFIAAIIGALPVQVMSEGYLVFLIIKEFLLVVNSTVNFYIYLVFNAKFRVILRKSFCGCRDTKPNQSLTKVETIDGARKGQLHSVSSSGYDSDSSTHKGIARGNKPGVYNNKALDAFGSKEKGYDNPAMIYEVPSDLMSS